MTRRQVRIDGAHPIGRRPCRAARSGATPAIDGARTDRSAGRSGARAALAALTAFVVGAAEFGPAPAAHAQNALGAGDRLDANPQVGAGRRNTAIAVEDFSARNNIVTGDVAGGFGFAGDVGYTSPRAFRGTAGSDAIIAFRAGSAFSAPTAVLGGLTYDRFTLASRRGAIEFSRDTTPIDVPLTDFGSLRQRELLDARVLIDRASATASTFGLFERAAQGAPVAQFSDGFGRGYAIVAAPLTGIRFEPIVVGEVRPLDVGMYDWRRLAEDAEHGRLSGIPAGNAFPALGMADPLAGAMRPQADGTGLSSPDRVDLSMAPASPEVSSSPDRLPSDRIDASSDLRGGVSDYDRIVDRLVVEFGARLIDDPTLRIEGDAEVRRRLRERIEQLSDELSGRRPATPEAPVTPDPAELPVQPRPSAVPGSDDPATLTGAEPPLVDELAGLLRHRQRIETLSPMQRSRVEQLIARGEQELGQGEFFLAEQSFDRALRLVPGHPMATAGMIHTQLAAGLYLSAALNLRRFFADSPEMIDARYADRLLPPQQRLDAAVARVRELMARGGRDAPNYALALAYLGQLAKSPDLTREGLAELAGSPADETLRALLTKVWLAE
ncbi:MAG TPA: hypothetical protein PKC43_08765 [Phycisphaerales bacterium]|nr:hypothetical protein [Phycisphaerales bacterium]HMP37527.1 hypothetical protein [Phycisphaerales bacterium]